ncbi:MAG: hypothetical protein IPO92_11260 [Saprospiraceae bacterium]|nr:hypothetical protein [Saprospiraceae bacterium]
MDNIKNKIAPFRVNDTYAALDYGYSYQDFLSSFDMTLGAHVKYGIKEYVAKRSESAKIQVQNINISPVFELRNVVRTSTNVRLSCFLNSDTPSEVTINYSIDNGPFIVQIVKDNGVSPDELANDNTYNININADAKGTISYYYTAKDQTGKESRWPVCNNFVEDIGYAKRLHFLLMNLWPTIIRLLMKQENMMTG